MSQCLWICRSPKYHSLQGKRAIKKSIWQLVTAFSITICRVNTCQIFRQCKVCKFADRQARGGSFTLYKEIKSALQTQPWQISTIIECINSRKKMDPIAQDSIDFHFIVTEGDVLLMDICKYHNFVWLPVIKWGTWLLLLFINHLSKNGKWLGREKNSAWLWMQVVIISENEHEKRVTELKHMQIRLILEGAGEYLEWMCVVRERKDYRFNIMAWISHVERSYFIKLTIFSLPLSIRRAFTFSLNLIVVFFVTKPRFLYRQISVFFLMSPEFACPFSIVW